VPAAAESAAWVTPSLAISIVGLLVSVSALLVTVRLFWWINLRRGRLLCAKPHSFAATFKHQDILITLPLVLHNDGAQVLVVQDLRLRLRKTPEQAASERQELEAYFEEHKGDFRPGTVLEIEPDIPPTSLSWRASRAQLDPSKEGRTMAAAFAVKSRSADTYFIEFGRRGPAALPRRGPHEAVVEVKLSDESDWVHLLTFDLHTEKVEPGNPYIPYSNDPEWEP
jgi:hypothetical protein